MTEDRHQVRVTWLGPATWAVIDPREEQGLARWLWETIGGGDPRA